MTTDYRALCAELADALESWQLGGAPPEDTADADLITRARAALAPPEVESSITFNESHDSEVMRVDQRGFHYRGELIEDAGLAHRLMVTFLQRHTSMHPEVVEREDAQPEPEGPTDEELDAIWFASGSGADGREWRAYARAVLSRWGRSAIEPTPKP